MTVGQLIKELRKYDKNMIVGISKPYYCQGSSWTGMYCGGDEFVDIIEVKFVEKDLLAGRKEAEKENHVEIIIDED